MNKFDEQEIKLLLDKDLITENQYKEITAYRSLNIFSLNAELKLFLYLSVLLFTSGIGILIYQNIDIIGHIALLSILLIVIVIFFYYCFKNSKGFQKTETTFENPVIEYLVLAANILTCIFIGYLQFQYKPFGTNYDLATLIPTLVSFICAYYFDNKSVLTIAITGLAAYIGLSVTPQDLLHNDFYSNPNLSYSAIILGGLLISWANYSKRIQLKSYFNIIYYTFALHILGIACISNLVAYYNNDFWLIFALILGASSYTFYEISDEINSLSLYIFMIVYAYIGFNILFFRILDLIDFSDIWTLIILASPIYCIGSIIMFIKLIKNFHKEIAE